MRIGKNHWLINTPVAHRGLWGNGIPENSLAAYKKAIENGYPIEIDIYSSTDGEIFVFHDDTLDRMTDGQGFIYEKSSAELKSLTLKGGGEIPTFKEVLTLCEGKTPLLIEFKDQPNQGYIEKAVNMLKDYKGEFAVQAFNPIYLKKIKKLAPEFLRGILASNEAYNLPFFKRLVVKYMPFNPFIKPDFISYYYKGLPLKQKKRPVLAWTVTSRQIKDELKCKCDNIIFEYFIPEE